MGDRHGGESSRAISVSSRDDFEMAAESMGNVHEVSKLTRILGHKKRRGSYNPSKGTDGRTITMSTQLLSECEKFLGTKFQRPVADAHKNLESLPAEDDVLDDDELSLSQGST